MTLLPEQIVVQIKEQVCQCVACPESANTPRADCGEDGTHVHYVFKELEKVDVSRVICPHCKDNVHLDNVMLCNCPCPFKEI